jgi:hypothetical protein
MKLGLVLLMGILPLGCATGAVGTDVGDAAPSASKDAGGKDAVTPKQVPDAGSSQTDAGQQPTDDAGVTVDDSTCAGQSTQAQCEQCCLTVHPTGYDVYHQELVSCACSSPGACATECATELCANQPTTTGDACEQCITASLTQGTGACYDGVAVACQGDVDCTALFGTCIPPCESK